MKWKQKEGRLNLLILGLALQMWIEADRGTLPLKGTPNSHLTPATWGGGGDPFDADRPPRGAQGVGLDSKASCRIKSHGKENGLGFYLADSLNPLLRSYFYMPRFPSSPKEQEITMENAKHNGRVCACVCVHLSITNTS